MIELSTGTVSGVMLTCYNRFNYKVGIAFSSNRRMYDFAKTLHSQYQNGLVPSTYYKDGKGIDEIFFDTGSSIKMFNGTIPSNVYGRDFDIVVVDPDITSEDTIEHLRSCERRMFHLRQHGSESDDMEIDTAPFDEFLNEFSITKT